MIVVGVDISGSMPPNVLDIAEEIIQTLSKKDKVFVFLFDNGVRATFTYDGKMHTNGWLIGGGTDLRIAASFVNEIIRDGDELVERVVFISDLLPSEYPLLQDIKVPLVISDPVTNTLRVPSLEEE